MEWSSSRNLRDFETPIQPSVCARPAPFADAFAVSRASHRRVHPAFATVRFRVGAVACSVRAATSAASRIASSTRSSRCRRSASSASVIAFAIALAATTAWRTAECVRLVALAPAECARLVTPAGVAVTKRRRWFHPYNHLVQQRTAALEGGGDRRLLHVRVPDVDAGHRDCATQGNCATLSTLPSGSLNHPTRAPSGNVMIPRASCPGNPKCSHRTPAASRRVTVDSISATFQPSTV